MECDASTDPASTGVATATDDCAMTSITPEPWINEFHYDNSGTDIGEFVEIAGPAGVDLSGYQLYLYNGSDGAPYVPSPIALSGIIDNESNGFGALSFATVGLQNGAPDGIALVKIAGSVVVQFISYEGAFSATSGPANGMMSVNVGVDEDPAPASGNSLQRSGTGNQSSDFAWVSPAAESPGSLNSGQMISNT